MSDAPAEKTQTPVPDPPTAPELRKIVRPKHNRWRTWIGLGITAFYLIFVAVYTSWGATLKNLAPNEFADTIAGVFAPLAFLWLVLGFFQQGEDLRVNGQALWLQGEELRNSVEQQRLLAQAQRDANELEERRLKAEADRLAREREEVERLARPDLIIVDGGYSTGPGGVIMNHSLMNRGADCLDLRVTIEDVVIKRARMAKGDSVPVQINVPRNYTAGMGIQTYRADYVDSLGNTGTQDLYLAPVSASGYLLLTTLH
jgi:hypothetical protein